MSSQTRTLSKKLEPSVAASSLVAVLHGYQRFISPLLSPACRFHPSCSAYAVESIQIHGAIRGCWLALRRLLKCGPWHPGGVDPVPLGSEHQSTDLKRQSDGVGVTPAEE